MTDKQPLVLPRYKIGYYSDEQGMRSSTPTGIPDPEGTWVRFEHAQTLIAHAQRRHEAELAAIGAGGLSGPLFGQRKPSHQRALENVALLADILNRRPAMNHDFATYADWTSEVYNLMGAISAAPANDAVVVAGADVQAAGMVIAMNAETQAPQQAAPAVPDDFGSAEHWKEKAQYWAGVAHRLRGEALRGEPVDGIIQPPTTSPQAPQQEVQPNYVVSLVVVKEIPTGVNTQNKLYTVNAASADEAVGKAVLQMPSDFPEHRLHTACFVAIPARPAPKQEVQEPWGYARRMKSSGWGLCCKREYAEAATDGDDAVKLYTAQPAPSGDAEDAARYRWLRSQDSDDFVFAVVKNAHFDVFGTPEELDAAIDAARKEGK